MVWLIYPIDRNTVQAGGGLTAFPLERAGNNFMPGTYGNHDIVIILSAPLSLF
jgi:hypothetical protein